MINIITGSIDSGKTTNFIELFKIIGSGDGFITRKVYIDDYYVGQEIIQLSTGKGKLWSVIGKKPDEWNEAFNYYNYSFSKEGLDFGESIIVSILQSTKHPIFIDEIGPLEVEEKGFHRLFSWCLNSEKEMYVVIREGCIKDVINKYNIKSYTIKRIIDGQTYL